jgi:hypothetical protein
MSLTRREILEQLSRLGIRSIDGLKKGCRNYEAYWSDILGRPIGNSVSGEQESLIQDLMD